MLLLISFELREYLQRYVSLGGVKPSIPFFEMLHCGVKLVQELISEEFIVQDIPLPSRIMEGAVISSPRKVKPFLHISFHDGRVLTGWPTD